MRWRKPKAIYYIDRIAYKVLIMISKGTCAVLFAAVMSIMVPTVGWTEPSAEVQAKVEKTMEEASKEEGGKWRRYLAEKIETAKEVYQEKKDDLFNVSVREQNLQADKDRLEEENAILRRQLQDQLYLQGQHHEDMVLCSKKVADYLSTMSKAEE